MLQVGIVGLPNVGKSTLFNALLKKQAALVANYPFATIEPNIGIVPVPDLRLQRLANITKTEEKMEQLPPIIPATVKFVDIAGLVKGASTGAGLGNQFLAHIREVDLICHVVRDFPDADIIREGSTDPKSDMEIINTELILADLQTLGKAVSGKRLEVSKEREIRESTMKKLQEELDKGKLAIEVSLTDEEREVARGLQLLTNKPVLYVVNTTYGATTNSELRINNSVEIDAKTEAELVVLSPEEQVEYLKELGKTESGLDRLVRKAYEMLGLISYFTAGEKEVRAWTIKRGTKAPEAAGAIHTDFIKGFIRAEVIAYEDYIKYNGKKGSADAGKMRLEGKEYEVKDGDVVEFRVNV